MFVLAKSIFSHCLNLLYPTACRKCGILIQQEHVVCHDCFKAIKPVASKTLSVGRYNVKVFAASSYDGVMRKLVCGKLYSDRVAGVDLARMIILQRVLENILTDCFVPIPLHWTRYANRGFNQAAVIAHELWRQYDVDVQDVLRRTRRTSFQSHVQQSERGKNVNGVFLLTKNSDLKNKHVMIVDDLMTTGSTLQEAARVIACQNPASISAVVACRAK